MNVNPKDNWVGKRLGKFKVLKSLGQGGMGAVYQAVHCLLQKTVCLKILFPALIQPGLKTVERFLREARSVASLEHPNIVRVFDIEEENGTYFIVMEYIDGKSLQQLLRKKDAFAVKETLEIAIQIAQALGAAHSKGIIHRDVKPANIMIDKQGKVKLTDFGLARGIDSAEEISSGNEVLGTPLYLAPEYIRGQSVDIQIDMYALGITLFHMLAGKPPYQGKNPLATAQMHISAPIPSIREMRGDVPLKVDNIIKKLMAKNPRKRFINSGELVEAFKVCLDKLALENTAKTLRLTPDHITSICKGARNRLTMGKKQVRVVVVEDSPIIRKGMCKALEENIFKVVGTFANGQDMLERIHELDPDVITLDISMPIMDGISTVKQLMLSCPKPVVMVSSFDQERIMKVFRALSLGALDFVWKTTYARQRTFKEQLHKKLRNASDVELLVPARPKVSQPMEKAKIIASSPAQWLVIVSAGDGGHHALLKIIPYLPKNIPCAVLLIQNTSGQMEELFCRYLDQNSNVAVKQLDKMEILREGVCYLADHLSSIALEIMPDGQKLKIVRGGGESENAFQQSLVSAAWKCGPRTVGIALSGSPKNALSGLKQLREGGGFVIAQDPKTCMRPELPIALADEKIASKVVADIDIPSVLWYFLRTQTRSVTKRMIKIARSRRNGQEKIAQKVNGSSVLVISANAADRALLSATLENEDCSLSFAKDSIDAFMHLARDRYDLIVSDIDMPDLDGFQFLEIKKRKGIDTPLVFLTARSDDKDELKGWRLGALDYIKKPVDSEILLMRIKKVLKS